MTLEWRVNALVFSLDNGHHQEELGKCWGEVKDRINAMTKWVGLWFLFLWKMQFSGRGSSDGMAEKATGAVLTLGPPVTFGNRGEWGGGKFFFYKSSTVRIIGYQELTALI